MYGFFKIVSETKNSKNPTIIIRPEFLIDKGSSNDLMIRGKDFYAVWDEETKLWSCDEMSVVEKIDAEIDRCREACGEKPCIAKYMSLSSSGSIDAWHKYVQKQLRDNFRPLDNKIIFSNMQTTKKDYATKKLSYPLEQGEFPAYEEIMSTLYDPEERDKLEWAIGSIISGDSKKIQKFIVLYGAPGSGKGTFLDIVQKLFDGYCSVFDAKALASNSSNFALESFKNNPLVAIQTDGDLSRIEDNTKLNSIVSHEVMEVNEKFKSKYSMRFNSFLFLGTNKPVKITESKSGLLRRLIDVNPSGRKIPASKYRELTKRVDFELGAIAHYCLEKYKSMGIDYYNAYVPLTMIEQTNDFYDFMEYYYYDFIENDYIILKDVWALYKSYSEMANVKFPLSMRAMRIEIQEYFEEYYENYYDDGKHLRNVYKGFKYKKFNKTIIDANKINEDSWLKLTSRKSIFDIVAADYPAQYASESGSPTCKWSDNKKTLKEIDTSKLHYVKLPKNHIVIDFDLKNDDGEKSLEKNVLAASKFPPTYAELSKSGSGIHLHYIYNGDVSKLSRVYDDNIEIKVFSGNSSLRRKFTRSTEIPISVINSGLPFKEEKMVDFTAIKNEKALRTLIKKNLNKEIHPNTKPSIDFIYKILEDAYKSGMVYDVSDMKQAILYFASTSSNNAEYCMSLVTKMKFTSEKEPEMSNVEKDDRIVFYDVEVFPNLFLVNWKFDGDKEVNRMINPKPEDIAGLITYKLIGFNNRRYDNHMLYARMMGYSNENLFKLSQRLVTSDKGVTNNLMFANAYNLSYADIYDFMSTKQSLKKWEIELGIHHQELGLPWDEPVPEERWEEVAEYCDNDVIATETLFHSKQCQADFLAREIIASISGLSVNHSTNSHSAKIIFGDNKHPQDSFVYTDLSTIFPGYEFKLTNVETELPDGSKVQKKLKQSFYKDIYVGEGGYVYAEPGMYENVWTFDVTSMHPHSIKELNLFGDHYTKIFYNLVEARVAIKNGDYETAWEMFDGKLKPYLKDKSQAKMLSNALKIVINSVYGLTSASFDSVFKDPRNVDNIVAKRGALFMIDLKCALEEKGIKVIHIKTDSIKISNPSKDIQDFIYEFGKKYGYSFEVENVFSKFCLVNDAVYIAKYAEPKNEDGKDILWSATGAQFAQPYVFKTLFSKEPIEFKDTCETKSVKTAIYIDLNESNPEEHNYKFIGKVGLFCPIKPGAGGGLLVAEREDKKGKKMSAVTGTKGYRWLEAEEVKNKHLENSIDKTYYISLVDEAVSTLSKFGDVEWFIG